MSFPKRNPLRPYFKSAQMLAYRMTRPLRAQRAPVFGIGLSRTGTKSLHTALRTLGYRSDHFSTHLLRFRGDTVTLDFDGVAAYEALTDITAAFFFRELAARFPRAKFVLTLRDVDGWLRSCERHFSTDKQVPQTLLRLRALLYGTTVYDPERFRTVYLRHVTAVRQFFVSRPNDLLEVDICGGTEWHPLCDFLGQPVPDERFPWMNNSADRPKNSASRG